jgi:ribonuclease HI
MGKKYYAVAVGRIPGVYESWFGPGGAEVQVRGFAKARFKGFLSRSEAEAFVREHKALQSSEAATPKRVKCRGGEDSDRQRKIPLAAGRIKIYTDGGSLGNPGPGGYGVVILDGEKRTEISGGFRLTTNNRMELMGCIVGLSQLKSPSSVTVFTDSRYVVHGIEKGWAKRWRKKNWMRNETEPAINPDLWERLLELCQAHEIEFVWLRGHAGHRENERCDRLSKQAASKPNLPIDPGYPGKGGKDAETRRGATRGRGE